MRSQQLAIEIRELTKRFGNVEALDSITIDVPEGAIYALVGQNGAGKSTLMRLLLNIIEPTSGTGLICGEPIRNLKERAFTRIGYVAEDQELPEWMTVKGYMNYLRRFYPLWDDANLLSDLKLPADRKIKFLSRGMRMKTALASVLAFCPSVIFMDEPFSGLDPVVRDELIETLLDRVADNEARETPPTTIFISSHDLAEVESFASHVAFLNEGKLIFAEPMESLTRRFREVTAYFDSLNSSLPQAHDLPDSWIVQEITSSALRFVHTQANDEQIEEEIREVLRDVTDIESEPMTLRAIFLALIKSDQVTVGRRS